MEQFCTAVRIVWTRTITGKSRFHYRCVNDNNREILTSSQTFAGGYPAAYISASRMAEQLGVPCYYGRRGHIPAEAPGAD